MIIDSNIILKYALSSVPLSNKHQSQLDAIIRTGGLVGGAAQIRKLEIKGIDAPEQIIDILISHKDDYNFCAVIARKVGPILEVVDLPRIAAAADRVQQDVGEKHDERAAVGFISGLADMLAAVPPDALYGVLNTKNVTLKKNWIRAELLLDALQSHHSSVALKVVTQLLLAGLRGAATAMHFILNHAEEDDEFEWSILNREHTDALISLLSDSEEGAWALGCLKTICANRRELASVMAQVAQREEGSKRIFLLWASNADNLAVVNAFREILSMPQRTLSRQKWYPLEHLRVEWIGHEELFVSLLRLHHFDLAYYLVESIYLDRNSLGIINIGEIDWLLRWLSEVRKGNDTEAWIFEDRIAYLLNKHLGVDGKKEIVAEFNKKTSKYRTILARSILAVRNDITTDDLSDDAIKFVISELSRTRARYFIWDNLLAKVSTEQFIRNTLMPLFEGSSGTVKENLAAILREAGRRHRRRYIPE